MITLDEAKKIAQEQFPDYPICSIRDIGEKWIFNYDAGFDSIPIPGIPFICVDKENGEVDDLPIPPVENLDIVNSGVLIYRKRRHIKK